MKYKHLKQIGYLILILFAILQITFAQEKSGDDELNNGYGESEREQVLNLTKRIMKLNDQSILKKNQKFYIHNIYQQGEEFHSIESFIRKLEVFVTPYFDIGYFLQGEKSKNCGYCFYYATQKMIEITLYKNKILSTVSSKHMYNQQKHQTQVIERTCLEYIAKSFQCEGAYTYELMMSLNQLWQLRNASDPTSIINLITSSYHPYYLQDLLKIRIVNPYQEEYYFAKNTKFTSPFVITICLDNLVRIIGKDQEFFQCENPTEFTKHQFDEMFKSNKPDRHLDQCKRKHALIFLKTLSNKIDPNMLTLVFWHQWAENEMSTKDGSEFKIIIDLNLADKMKDSYFPCRIGAGIIYSVSYQEIENEAGYKPQRDFFQNIDNRYTCKNASDSTSTIIKNAKKELKTISTVSERSEDSIEEGQAIVSDNQNFYLKLQKDGDLVLYDRSQQSIEDQHPEFSKFCTKSGNQSESNPFRLTMENNGNLIIRDQKQNKIWEAGVYNYYITQNNRLFVTDDGDVVVESDQWKDFPIWKNGRHSILFKQFFSEHDVLYSPSMLFRLKFNNQGQLCLIQSDKEEEIVVWNTNNLEKGESPYFLQTIDKQKVDPKTRDIVHSYQLLIQDSNQKIIWKSEVYTSQAIQRLRLTNTGILIIEDYTCQIIGILNEDQQIQEQNQQLQQSKSQHFERLEQSLNNYSHHQIQNQLKVLEQPFTKEQLQTHNIVNNFTQQNNKIENLIYQLILSKALNSNLNYQDIRRTLRLNTQFNKQNNQYLDQFFKNQNLFYKVIDRLLEAIQKYSEFQGSFQESIIKIGQFLVFLIKENNYFQLKKDTDHNEFFQFRDIQIKQIEHLAILLQSQLNIQVEYQQMIQDEYQNEDSILNDLILEQIQERIEKIQFLLSNINKIFEFAIEINKNTISQEKNNQENQILQQSDDQQININSNDKIYDFSLKPLQCSQKSHSLEIAVELSGFDMIKSEDYEIEFSRQMKILQLQKSQQRFLEILNLNLTLEKCTNYSIQGILGHLPKFNEKINLYLNCGYIDQKQSLKSGNIEMQIYNQIKTLSLAGSLKQFKFFVQDSQQIRIEDWYNLCSYSVNVILDSNGCMRKSGILFNKEQCSQYCTYQYQTYTLKLENNQSFDQVNFLFFDYNSTNIQINQFYDQLEDPSNVFEMSVDILYDITKGATCLIANFNKRLSNLQSLTIKFQDYNHANINIQTFAPCYLNSPNKLIKLQILNPRFDFFEPLYKIVYSSGADIRNLLNPYQQLQSIELINKVEIDFSRAPSVQFWNNVVQVQNSYKCITSTSCNDNFEKYLYTDLPYFYYSTSYKCFYERITNSKEKDLVQNFLKRLFLYPRTSALEELFIIGEDDNFQVNNYYQFQTIHFGLQNTMKCSKINAQKFGFYNIYSNTGSYNTTFIDRCIQQQSSPQCMFDGHIITKAFVYEYNDKHSNWQKLYYCCI